MFLGRLLISQKPVFVVLKNPWLALCKPGSDVFAGSAPKRSKQRFSVKSKGSHNKSFKRTPLTRRRLTPALCVVAKRLKCLWVSRSASSLLHRAAPGQV